jgi:type VI secretion system protein ImpI
MSLRLVIEHSPHPQRVADRVIESGDLSIGRGADCDWQLDDPDSYISRKHCVVSARDGQFTVTDASRGGLFVDGRDIPLGIGVTARLEDGTRLRLGDVVIRAEVLTAANHNPPAPTPAPAQGYVADDFFAARTPDPPRPPRPGSLPQPFEGGPEPFAATPPPRPAAPPLFDDPFTMDPVATPAPTPAPAPSDFADFDFGFDTREPAAPVSAPVQPAPRPEVPPAAPVSIDWPAAAPLPAPAPVPVAAPPQPAAEPPRTDLVEAFFRGLALDPATLPENGSPAEFEALGRRFRQLTEGLITLLRTRAMERNSVRVARTVIGSADVNPLKFLPTTEEALSALVAPRGRGYLDPEAAIAAAFHDLNDHHLRSWTALQSSLRRMIDRFDPAAFEAEVETVGVVKALLTGNRSARLWQLYSERYRDIAKSAEDRFLGDVGMDFRDAYEGNREDRT